MKLKPVLRMGLLSLVVTCSPLVQAADCTLTATPIDFGAVMQLNPSSVDVQGLITVECVADFNDVDPETRLIYTDYVISINAGSSGSPGMRSMQGPAASTLPYNLYQDPAHSIVWGDGSSGTNKLAGQIVYAPEENLAGVFKQVEHICYARIPRGVNVPPGTYSDQITLTLVF